MNENNIDTFYVLDLDRTLFNTPQAALVMSESVAVVNPQVGEVIAAMSKETERNGKTFLMRDEIGERLSEVDAVKVDELYVKRGRKQDFLLPGAKELIDYLTGIVSVEVGILTFGSPLGQKLKLQVTGLESLPHLIINNPYKSRHIASWQLEDGSYQLPGELGGFNAKYVVLVDDKIEAFDEMTEGMQGYWIPNEYSTGDEIVPEHVEKVSDLHELLEVLRAN